MRKEKIYITYGKDAREMAIDLLKAADIAGRIPKGASIGLKPNLVVADRPENGATTHTGIVIGIIEYLQEHGFDKISVIEGSWLGDSTVRAFSACGYNEIAKKYNVKLFDLKKDSVRSVSTPVGSMKICEKALDCDYLISLPVLKGHCQTRMTCALKNSKGCIPDSEKRRFHTLGLHRPIAALGAALKPDLFIVDSICGDLNFEEGGNPIQTNRMMLGFDPVQIDSYGCRLMGIDPVEVDYIGLAQQWNVGEMYEDESELVYLNDPSAAPAYPRPSGLVSRLTKGVQQNDACSACYGNLVHALYRMQDDFGRNVDIPIYIGQGNQGKKLEGIGIGRCCSGAELCVKGCPPDAESILQVLMDNSY